MNKLSSIVICPIELQRHMGPKRFQLVIVREGRPGYIPSKYGYFSSLKEAWEKADELNFDMGILNREKVIEIVKSSWNMQETLYEQE